MVRDQDLLLAIRRPMTMIATRTTAMITTVQMTAAVDMVEFLSWRSGFVE